MDKKGKTPQDIRQANLILIFRLLRERKSLSCSELAKGTGLSNTAVEKIVDGLYARSLLLKSAEKPETAPGRNPIRYIINPDARAVLFFDFTHDSYGLIDLAGGVIFKKDMPDCSLWDNIKLDGFFQNVKDEIADYRLQSLSVALVGKQDRRSGEIVLSRKFTADLNLEKIAEEIFGVPIQITNDTYLILISEREKFGSENIMYVYFGKGISCAFCINGKLYTGGHDYAGELGIIKQSDGTNYEQHLSVKRLQELDRQIENGNYTAFMDETGGIMSLISDTAKLFDFDDIIIGGPYKNFLAAFAENLTNILKKEKHLKTVISASPVSSPDFGLLSSALAFAHTELIKEIKQNQN